MVKFDAGISGLIRAIGEFADKVVTFKAITRQRTMISTVEPTRVAQRNVVK